VTAPYKRAHRHYAAALAADVRTAGAKVRSDTSYWQTALEGYVRDHSLDAVVESALADPDDFRASSAAYRSSRHRIEVVALATPDAWSQLGMYSSAGIADADQVLAVCGLSRPAGRPARPRLSRGCSVRAHSAGSYRPVDGSKVERRIRPGPAPRFGLDCSETGCHARAPPAPLLV
jgi:hypothetical protein